MLVESVLAISLMSFLQLFGSTTMPGILSVIIFGGAKNVIKTFVIKIYFLNSVFHASFFNRVIAMRFKLVLEKTSKKGILPINYQYPLSACIYKVIQSADEEFSRFLHTDGYALGHKKFKLFTFSPLRIYPFRVLKEYQRLEMTSDYAELEVRFMIDKAAESFITGLFHNQHLRIADRCPH